MTTSSDNTKTKCVGAGSLSTKGLSTWFVSGNTEWEKGRETEKWSTHNSEVVSKDTAALTREEKGVVSSVFAKVIEGAEIL